MKYIRHSEALLGVFVVWGLFALVVLLNYGKTPSSLRELVLLFVLGPPAWLLLHVIGELIWDAPVGRPLRWLLRIAGLAVLSWLLWRS